MQVRGLLSYLAIATFSIVISGSSCPGASDSSTREKGEARQESLMERAQREAPVPNVTNFRTRKAVAKWMERMDRESKEFYIYLYGENGNIIRYWVASTRPISVCSYLTPTSKVIYADYQTGVATAEAPSLDGVYSTGGAGCNQVFFFTAATDALVMINGSNLLTVDQPMDVDVEPLKVKRVK